MAVKRIILSKQLHTGKLEIVLRIFVIMKLFLTAVKDLLLHFEKTKLQNIFLKGSNISEDFYSCNGETASDSCQIDKTISISLKLRTIYSLLFWS